MSNLYEEILEKQGTVISDEDLSFLRALAKTIPVKETVTHLQEVVGRLEQTKNKELYRALKQRSVAYQGIMREIESWYMSLRHDAYLAECATHLAASRHFKEDKEGDSCKSGS